LNIDTRLIKPSSEERVAREPIPAFPCNESGEPADRFKGCSRAG
jgi:hypothetical protein